MNGHQHSEGSIFEYHGKECPCFCRFIYGLAEQFIQEITFDNIDVSMAQDAVPGVPAMMTGIEEMSRQGFILALRVRFPLTRCRLKITRDQHFY